MTEKAFTGKYFYGTGRRKTSTARVRLYPDNPGQIVINGLSAEAYFKPSTLATRLFQPLTLVGKAKDFGVSVKVLGGGMASQADAVRHGVARALVAFDAELKVTLKKAKYLTRDARAKERKKPGLRRARRAPQFSKR